MRRNIQNLGQFLLTVWILSNIVIPTVSGQEKEAPLPVEATLNVKKFGDGTPMALSADGNWVAYVIQDVKKTKSMDAETFNRTGVPPSATGTDIWLQNIGTGAAVNLTEGEGDSWFPAWSPDGHYLAFLSDRDGSGCARLWIWDIRKRELRKVSDSDVYGDGFAWMPDSQRLLVTLRPGQTAAEEARRKPPSGEGSRSLRSAVTLYKSDRNSSGEATAARSDPWRLDLYLRDMALLELNTGRAVRIVQQERVASYSISPDGSYVSYTVPKQFERPGSQQVLFDLVILDLSAKKRQIVGEDIRLEYDGAAFSWSPDGKRVSFRAGGMEERTYDCYVLDIQSGITRNVSHLEALKHPSRSRAVAPLWDKDGNFIYFLREGTLWRGPASGNKAEKIGSIRDRQITQILSLPGYQLWTPDEGRSLLAATYDDEGKQDGIYKLDLINRRSTRLLERGQCYACINSLQPFAVDVVGKRVLFFAEDAGRDEDLWVSDATFQKPLRLTHLNGQFDGYKMGPARLIHWLSDTGEPLEGALLLPPNYQEGIRYPLIVWVYGGDSLSDNYDHFGLAYSGVLNMQLFATRGYAVLLPDAPLRVGTPMFDLAATVLPGVNKVVEMGIADPDRLGVMGHSYGGYSTLSLIVQTTRFKAAVEMDGMGDYMAFYGEMNGDGTAIGTAMSEQSQRLGWMGGTPWQFRDRYISNSPVFYLDKVETPLLIVHGANDRTVAPFLGDEVFVGLRRLGKEVEYAKYEGESHSPLYWSYPDQVDLCNRLIDWFEQHLHTELPAKTASLAR